ncbi:MAG: hypothetical protein EOO05_02945, partial [Chitinophagaceae bacterium]
MAELRKEDFLAIASHELKTPLTTIKGYLQMAKKSVDGKTNDELLGYLNKMDKSIHRLSGVVTELLNLSSID